MDGTWTQLKDRFLLGVGDTYITVNSTGGEARHILTEDEMPVHQHTIGNANESGGEVSFSQYLPGADNTIGYIGNIYTDFAGANQAHNNMPPYLTVYMWKRTK